jgi:hypothetical protein
MPLYGTEPPFWVPEMTIDYVLKKYCPFAFVIGKKKHPPGINT